MSWSMPFPPTSAPIRSTTRSRTGRRGRLAAAVGVLLDALEDEQANTVEIVVAPVTP